MDGPILAVPARSPPDIGRRAGAELALFEPRGERTGRLSPAPRSSDLFRRSRSAPQIRGGYGGGCSPDTGGSGPSAPHVLPGAPHLKSADRPIGQLGALQQVDGGRRRGLLSGLRGRLFRGWACLRPGPGGGGKGREGGSYSAGGSGPGGGRAAHCRWASASTWSASQSGWSCPIRAAITEQRVPRGG